MLYVKWNPVYWYFKDSFYFSGTSLNNVNFFLFILQTILEMTERRAATYTTSYILRKTIESYSDVSGIEPSDIDDEELCLSYWLQQFGNRRFYFTRIVRYEGEQLPGTSCPVLIVVETPTGEDKIEGHAEADESIEDEAEEEMLQELIKINTMYVLHNRNSIPINNSSISWRLRMRFAMCGLWNVSFHQQFTKEDLKTSLGIMFL